MREASYRYRDPLHSDDTYLVLASRLLVEAAADEADTSPQDHRRWPIWQLLAPHAFHLLRALSTMPKVELSLSEQVAHVVDLATRYLFSRGLSSQAKVEYDGLYRICHDLLGAEHPRTLAAGHGIALILTANGEYIQAQAEYEVVLELRRRILGEEHPDTLATRGNLAGVLHDRGDYAAAQAEYEAVLELRRRILGEEHPDTLTTRSNLAGVYFRIGRHRAAEAEMRAVLAIQGRTLGATHPQTRATRNNLKAMKQIESGTNQPVLWHGPGKRKKKKR